MVPSSVVVACESIVRPAQQFPLPRVPIGRRCSRSHRFSRRAPSVSAPVLSVCVSRWLRSSWMDYTDCILSVSSPLPIGKPFRDFTLWEQEHFPAWLAVGEFALVPVQPHLRDV